MRNFVIGVKRIDGSDNATQGSNGIKGDCEFGNVRTENPEDIALLETPSRKTGGHVAYCVGELRICDDAASRAFNQRRLIA
jgi:hypothetical protein